MPVFTLATGKRQRAAAAKTAQRESAAEEADDLVLHSDGDEEHEEGEGSDLGDVASDYSGSEEEEEEEGEEGEVEEEEEETDAPVSKRRRTETAPASQDDGEEEGEEGEDGAGASGTAAAAAAVAARAVEFSEPAQWVERMTLTATRPLPADLRADDDPKREEAFIQQTLLSARRGLELLEAAGVPWRRPADYYAEMYKSDTHMNDVRQAMEAAKARVEAQAHRRAMKDQKKYGKEVQAEVLRQRAKHKRDMQDRISDWKKKRGGAGAAASGLRDLLDDDDDANNAGRGAGKGGGGGKRSRAEQHRPRNLRPGGAKKRPGKNARRRG